jgi:hypothetical protein
MEGVFVRLKHLLPGEDLMAIRRLHTLLLIWGAYRDMTRGVQV